MSCSLPQTEALRLALELLNDMPAKEMTLLVDSVAVAAPGTNKGPSEVSDAGDHRRKAVVFLWSQLCYAAANDEARVRKILESDVSTPYGASQRLRAEHVSLITARWLEHGKQHTQEAREGAVRHACRAAAASQEGGDQTIAVQANVMICSGHVLEEVGDAGSSNVDYALQSAAHKPQLRVLLPPTAAHSNKTSVLLDTDGAYSLFQTMDAIQQAMDRVMGVGVATN